MEFYENLHSVADSNDMIIDFANFCEKVHDKIECKREDCELNLFVGCLVEFLKKDRTMAERRWSFISHCNNYKKSFKSMFKLDNNREYCFDYLQLLKVKRGSLK